MEFFCHRKCAACGHTGEPKSQSLGGSGALRCERCGDAFSVAPDSWESLGLAPVSIAATAGSQSISMTGSNPTPKTLSDLLHKTRDPRSRRAQANVAYAEIARRVTEPYERGISPRRSIRTNA